jgi:hypothetical protein
MVLFAAQPIEDDEHKNKSSVISGKSRISAMELFALSGFGGVAV